MNIFNIFGRSSAVCEPAPTLSATETPGTRLVSRPGLLSRAAASAEARTIPAILSTEGRVLVFDRRVGEVIEEVLIADGARHPDQVPLLDSHRRDGSGSVIGSVRAMKVDGDKLRGTVHVGRGLGEEVDQIWQRIIDGHLTDGSVGYRYGSDDYVDIRPGDRATVAGRTWAAAENVTLRIVTGWDLREYSVTPIGADEAAKLNRSHTLPGESIRAATERPREFAEQHRGLVPDELIEQAANENWTKEMIGARFLQEACRNEPATVRRAPDTGVPSGGGNVGIHVADNTPSRAALVAGVALRAGFGLDHPAWADRTFRSVFADSEIRAGWLGEAARIHQAGGQLTDGASRALEQAQRGPHHLMDLVRAGIEADGMRGDIYNPHDLWRAGLSSASVSAIFTTHFAVELMEGYAGAEDTTRGWTRESDLPNLQKVERKQMGKATSLKKRVRGESASHVTIDAVGEEYRLAEYAGQFFVDFQDALDDRFGALDSVMPAEMGEAAAELRADLVYAILLSNPNLGRDNTALFHADHGNLHADRDLTSENLGFAKSKMSTQKKGERLIGVQPRGLIVPDSKEHVAWELVNSADKRDNNDGRIYGTRNWVQGRFNVIPEPRLDVGVTDPDTGDFVAGQPDAQYLSAEGGRHGIEVGFLAGTGRRPTIRRFTATEGRFGWGWDVQHFIGAKALGYEGLAKMVDPAG